MQEMPRLKAKKRILVNFQELQKLIMQWIKLASENIVSCLLLLLLLLVAL